MARLESLIATRRPRPRPIAAAAGLVLLVLVGGSSGAVSRLPEPSPSPSRSALPSQAHAEAWAAEKPNSTTVVEKASAGAVSVTAASPSPSLAQTTSADIEPAFASRSAWIIYQSKTYKFVIERPADWPASETATPGWAIFSGWDDSDIAVTWRTVPIGTTLDAVAEEVRTAMSDSGFATDGGGSSLIAGLPARILVLDGKSSSGQARHGIIGIVVTATGRYRVELWSRPGADVADAKLYDALIGTFAITDTGP